MRGKEVTGMKRLWVENGWCGNLIVYAIMTQAF